MYRPIRELSSEVDSDSVSLPNILRDFADDSDGDDHSEIETLDDESDDGPVLATDILSNVDSDENSEGKVHDDDECLPDISEADDDEEDDDDDGDDDEDDDEDGSVDDGPWSRRAAGHKYTESDFEFLDEEWLHLANETSEDDISDTE
jgi:hypothetical protein